MISESKSSCVEVKMTHTSGVGGPNNFYINNGQYAFNLSIEYNSLAATCCTDDIICSSGNISSQGRTGTSPGDVDPPSSSLTACTRFVDFY